MFKTLVPKKGAWIGSSSFINLDLIKFSFKFNLEVSVFKDIDFLTAWEVDFDEAKLIFIPSLLMKPSVFDQLPFSYYPYIHSWI